MSSRTTGENKIFLERNSQIAKMERGFQSLCQTLQISVPKQAFTRWLVDQDHEEGHDALIPSEPYFGQLYSEMAKQGCPRDLFQNIAYQLKQNCTHALSALQKIHSQHDQTGDGGIVEVVNQGQEITLSFNEVDFKIN